MKSFLLARLLPALALSLAISGTVLAQAPVDGGPTPSATAVPLDGGASLLLASGVAYSIARLRNRRKRA